MRIALEDSQVDAARGPKGGAGQDGPWRDWPCRRPIGTVALLVLAALLLRLRWNFQPWSDCVSHPVPKIVMAALIRIKYSRISVGPVPR